MLLLREPHAIHAEGGQRRWLSRKVTVAIFAALVLGVIAGIGAVIYIKAQDDSASRAAESVRAGNSTLSAVSAALATAGSLDEVRAGGQQARNSAERLRAALVDARTIEQAKYRSAVNDALSADLAALEALARLAALEDTDLADWEDISRGLEGAEGLLRDAQARLVHLDYNGPHALPVAQVARAATHLDEVIPTAQDKLSSWQRRYNKSRRNRRADLAVANSYASSVRSFLGQYAAQRTSMSSWMGKVETAGVSFEEAYDFLADAAGERASVRRGMASVDAPPAFSSIHNRLLGVLDDAVAAVDSAYDGTLDYQFDFDSEYSNYSDTPGWTTFRSESDRISTEFSSAKGAWEGVVATERKKIQRRRLPRKPEV